MNSSAESGMVVVVVRVYGNREEGRAGGQGSGVMERVDVVAEGMVEHRSTGSSVGWNVYIQSIRIYLLRQLMHGWVECILARVGEYSTHLPTGTRTSPLADIRYP